MGSEIKQMRQQKITTVMLGALQFLQRRTGFAAEDLANSLVRFEVMHNLLLQLFALRGGKTFEFAFSESYGAESSHRRISLEFAPMLVDRKLTSLRA
jgi:hypothetical protein